MGVGYDGDNFFTSCINPGLLETYIIKLIAGVDGTYVHDHDLFCILYIISRTNVMIVSLLQML